MAEVKDGKKRALALVAAGTEEMELVITVDILRRCGIDVTVALVLDTEDCTGQEELVATCSRGVNVKADTTLNAYLKEIAASDTQLPDVVILPGGLEGSRQMAKAAAIGQLLQRCNAAEKLIAAICAAPTALVAHGKMFAGRRVTSYPSFKDQMKEAGYNWEEPAANSPVGRVVRDGNLLTSMGPGTSFDFGLNIGSILMGQQVAEKVAAGMLYKWPM